MGSREQLLYLHGVGKEPAEYCEGRSGGRLMCKINCKLGDIMAIYGALTDYLLVSGLGFGLE
jgi:hypothetical protein